MTDLIRTEFANEKQVYSPGDEVLGNVVIRCQTSCKANSKFLWQLCLFCMNRITA